LGLRLRAVCYNLAISMERAGEFLGKVVRKLERPEASLAWLAGSWATVVGKTLAAHTKPVRYQSGCLEIAADGKGWKKQLESMKQEFRARVNQAWGGNLVREIKFVAAKPGPKRVPRELDNEHTPFVRRRKG
jgi:predicted nucleic acid-binding Zn ribbon protein